MDFINISAKIDSECLTTSISRECFTTTGKGKRRVKGKTLDLNSFLGNQTAAPGYAVVTPKRDWADYVEDEAEDKFSSYRKDERIVLPTAPKACRGPNFDVSKVPSEPPFTAYIGNLPFDITEEEISRFFGNLTTISVRLPREGGDRGRMKGFGYAEFGSKQALIDALSLDGESLKNRPVRVSLAGENENGRVERKSDNFDRTASDWRAAPKGENSYSSRLSRNGGGSYSSRFEDGDRDQYRIRSSFGGEDRGRFESRYDSGRYEPGRYDTNGQHFESRRNNDRGDFGFGNSDRDSGNRGFGGRRFGEGGFDSYDRNRGFDRGPRSDRRDDFDSRRDESGFLRNRREEKREDRKDDFEVKDDVEPDKGAEYQERPKERTRLQLKPRSVPVGDQASAPVSSIFGGAKPVDTAAKEREIELRLAREKDKTDVVSKLAFTGEERKIKLVNEDIKKYPDDSVEKSFGESFSDRPFKVIAHHKMDEDLVGHENGVPVDLISNKFAHLDTDAD